MVRGLPSKEFEVDRKAHLLQYSPVSTDRIPYKSTTKTRLEPETRAGPVYSRRPVQKL